MHLRTVRTSQPCLTQLNGLNGPPGQFGAILCTLVPIYEYESEARGKEIRSCRVVYVEARLVVLDDRPLMS